MKRSDLLITKQPEQIRGYLLQSLSDPDATAVELKLLTDPNFGEEFDAMVDTIIGQYLDHELSPEDRDRTERYFFKSSIRREELNLAASMKVLTAEFLS